MTYLNLDQNPSHDQLNQLAQSPPNLKSLLGDKRSSQYRIQHGDLRYDYDKSLVDDTVLSVFQDWVDGQDILGQYRAILAGEHLNISENRAITHHQTRQSYTPLLEQIVSSRESLIRKGIQTLVVVGIGGSELGPKAIYEALVDSYDTQFDVIYISNIDAVKTQAILSRLSPESTCFLMTSKSGTTLEMILNWDLIVAWNAEHGRNKEDLKAQTLTITTPGSPLTTADFAEVFTFDESVGGRFATTSACGIVLIGLVFGREVVVSFLEGAAEMDQACLSPTCKSNAALMAACIGVWHRSYLGMPNLGIIAYASSLLFFVKHLQQVDCESNGKSVNRYQQPISYPTGPMVIYGQGTNAQHAFFQSLHQGPDVMPIEFIGVKKTPVIGSEATQKQMHAMQHHLNTNLKAQALALAEGKVDSDPNKSFPGNRPSMTLWLDTLTPKNLGALLAFYENKVLFQGCLWNLNSFDQEGVQLGKDLAKKLL